MHPALDIEKFDQLLRNASDAGVQSIRDLLVDIRDTVRSFLARDGLNLTTGDFRTQINSLIVRIVHQITHADCVFVRRLNSDGSATLAHEVKWWVEPRVGRPPLIKLKNAGMSTYFLNAAERSPKVVGDIRRAPSEVKAAHARTIDLAGAEDKQVQDFVNWIRAEVYIPLQAKGKLYAAIIAVSGRPYDDDNIAYIEDNLRDWQELLSFLYFVGLELDQETQLGSCISDINAVTLSITSALSEDEFLKKMATVLTCQQGLRWHRFVLFAFEGSYPADAVCVMAIGGPGTPDWAATQTRVSFLFDSLADYLNATEESEYGACDPLYQLSQAASLLRIPKERFASDHLLHALFSTQLFDAMPKLDKGNVVWLGKDCPWLFNLPWTEAIFPESARSTDRCLVPIVTTRSSLCIPVGFAVLDNPYPRFVETKYTPATARLFCDLCAPHLADRGMGTSRWLEELQFSRKFTDATRSRMNDGSTPSVEIITAADEYVSSFQSRPHKSVASAD